MASARHRPAAERRAVLRLLQRQAHQGLLQIGQPDLARDALRGLDRREQVEPIGATAKVMVGTAAPNLDQAGDTAVELPYLALGAPAQVAVPGVSQVGWAI